MLTVCNVMQMLHVFLYYDLDDHGEAIWYVYIWVRRFV